MENLFISTMSIMVMIVLSPFFLTFALFGFILKKTWFYLMSKVEIDE